MSDAVQISPDPDIAWATIDGTMHPGANPPDTGVTPPHEHVKNATPGGTAPK